MGHKIVQVVNTVVRGAIYSAKIENKFWQQFWKHPYDKIIRGSVIAGGVASGNYNTFVDQPLDSGISKKKSGITSSPSYQARRRRKFYPRKCNCSKSGSYSKRRRSRFN